jgi:outer membrane receptor protein involved in Fe transport
MIGNAGSSFRAFFFGLASLATALGGGGALAQDTARPGVADEDADLEEVIVTARKRSERLQDVPTAISVFSNEALERLNVVSVDELAKLTTGLTFDSDFGRLADRPILRGQANILGDSGVSYFIDGVYYTGTLLDLDLDNVESIQVVKGPQSALYGRNTYSGAILVTTRAPTQELAGSAKVEYAEFEQGKVSASISGPLVADTLAASLGGTYYTRDGVSGNLWRNRFDGKALGEEESKSANLGLYWTPGERLDVRTRVYWSEQQDGPPPLFLQGYQVNNIFRDNGNQRPNVIGSAFFPVATGGGSVYLGANRYYVGEVEARQLNVDARRSLGVEPEIAGRRLLAATTVDFEINESWTATYVGGYNRERSENAYDFDYQSTSYGPFMTSSVGLRPRAGAPAGTYEYAVSTGAPAANFSAVGSARSRDSSHELRLRFEGERLNLLFGAYYFDGRSDAITRQTPVATWGAQLVESLAVLQARMQAACASFFQNRPGFPNCTSVVRRATAANPAIVAFDSTANVWTTYEDSISRSAVENKAAFAAVTFEPSESLELGAEVRVARETQERLPGQQNTIAYLTTLVENTPFSSRTTTAYQDAEFDSVTPRFTARYDLSDDRNLYAVAAKGTKPGGINSVRAEAIGFGSFDEEDAWSFELGTKNTFLDGRMLLNVAVFDNKIDGYQLTDSVVYADGTPSTLVKNVGEVEISGLELELAYSPARTRGLDLRLNYSYTDTEIKEGQDANEGVLLDVADDGQLNCSRGLAPAFVPLVAAIRAANPNIAPTTLICHNDVGTQYFGAFGSIAGRRLPRVPEHNVNVGFDYARPLAGEWLFSTSANVSYESKKYVQVDNLAFYGEATLLNASIGIGNDTWSIRLWGKNLTDEDSVVSVSRFTDATNQSLRAFFGRNRLPRQIGLAASMRF